MNDFLHRFPLLLAAVVAFAHAESSPAVEDTAAGRTTVLVVMGPGGTEEYGEKFRQAAATWKQAAQTGGANFEAIGLDTTDVDATDSARLEERLREFSADKNNGPLWLVLIGHGTFDGRAAKFNVRGPDFTDADLAAWLKDFDGPLAVINTASASAPFLTSLAKNKGDRVLITATKSASEVYYPRFGEFFAEAIAGLKAADVDNDDQVSLLEAFLYSADQVAQFYESEGRLATEHALIDDTGDGLGTRPDWFEGVRATKVAKSGAEPDGERAHQFILVPNEFERRLSTAQRTRRDELERQVRALVRKRAELDDDGAYYAKLEPLLLEIARIYQSVGAAEGEEVEEAAGKNDGARSSSS